METPVKKERLFCLDALRGIDIFYLTVFHGFLVALCVWLGASKEWLYQLEHPEWIGITVHDQVMPLFIFMSGAAVPLALKRLVRDGKPTAAFFRKIAFRFVELWILGMFVQGLLTTFDIMMIHPYSNTLQSIAVGYVVAAMVMLIPWRWVRFVFPFLLAIAYTIILGMNGDYTIENCFALNGDMPILAALGFPDGADAYNLYGYGWFYCSFMFAAIAVWGSNATEIIRREGVGEWRKAGELAVYSIGLLILGLVLNRWIPCIKHIWSFTFVCYAMSIAFGLLCILYIVTDIWKFRRGWGIFILFGQCALTAYLIRSGFGGTLFAFCDRFLTPGIKGAVSPECYQVLKFALAGLAIIWAVRLRKRLKDSAAKVGAVA